MKEHLKKHELKEQHKKKEYYVVASAEKGYLTCKTDAMLSKNKHKARKFFSLDEAETARITANELLNEKFIAIHSNSPEAKTLEKIFHEQ